MESNGGGWLADSLLAVNNNVKKLLKLIEDKNIQISSVESETEDWKMPAIATCVGDLHNQYHLLAERYSQLAKEQGENVHELDANFASPFYTPVSKFTEHKLELQAVGSDSRLRNLSDKNGFGSSSTSLTDSDLENSNLESLTNDGDSGGEKKAAQNKDANNLLKRIDEYEKELQIANTKVRSSDEEASLFKSKLEDSEVVVKHLKDELDDAHVLLESLGMEKSKVSELEKRTSSYEDELSKFTEEIQRLKDALADAQNALHLKDTHYQSGISNLLEQKKNVEKIFEEHQLQIKSFEDEILEVKSAHDAKEALWQDELKSLRAENVTKADTVETLSKYTDALKQKFDMANARLETLTAEISHKDNVIQQLNERINHLTSVNTSLNANNNQLRRDLIGVQQLEIRVRGTQKALIEAVSESDRLNECICELRARVSELEIELDEQRVLVAEGAELKREAIRQLCFSLEHYRTEYLELKEAVIGKKRCVGAQM